MMIRSMPPASAHLALMPVPAPPPMIGLPAATWARSRRRHSSRVKKLIRQSSANLRAEVVGEALAQPRQARVVDPTYFPGDVGRACRPHETQANHRGLTQSTTGKLRIGGVDRVVPIGFNCVGLRADTTDQQALVCARQQSHNERGTKFSAAARFG